MMNKGDTVANLQEKSQPAFEEHHCMLPVFLRLWMCQKKKTKFVRRVWSRETLLVTLWHTSNDGRLTSHCRIPKFHWRPVKAPSPSGLRHDSPCSESKVRPWHSFCTSLLNMISRLQRCPKKSTTLCQVPGRKQGQCTLPLAGLDNWNQLKLGPQLAKWCKIIKRYQNWRVDNVSTSFNIIQHV